MKKLRIVFMGTPDFAVTILNTIYNSEHEIVGVITAPDKPAGRGQKIHQSAVKKYALEKELKILQPTRLQSEDFIKELQQLQADVQVVVAFRMLPKVVWNMPKLGTFNLHASLLPQYRGAAPINWAIINGESKTGVTTFFIDENIDTGAIILHKELPILPEENAGELHDKLMHLGSLAVQETLQQIANNTIKTIVQPQIENRKTAYKLNRENCKINWQKNGAEIYNLIRGLSPYPAAWTFLKDKTNKWSVKIYKTKFVLEKHTISIGKVKISKKEMKIAVIDGFIYVEELQFPGKRKMKIQDFLNGMQFVEEITVL